MAQVLTHAAGNTLTFAARTRKAPPMRFFSDNAAPVHPAVMAAIADACAVDTAYDGDRHSMALDDAFSALFDIEVAALWVPTGTAANCLALAAMCPAYGGIICHREAHIQVDEAGAPGFYTGGAGLILVDGAGAKIAPETIDRVRANIRDDVHQLQPHAVSITQATEYGRVYTPGEVAAIGERCRAHGLSLHMDGARFANAVAHLGCHPGDVTWRAGVRALSFGCVKNGGMNAEAIILFDRALASEVRVRRKRAGHLLSKGRFMAAQLLAMARDGLWLDNAARANAAAAVIGRAAGDRLLHAVEANEIFLSLTPDEAARLRASGYDFYDWGEGAARLVTSWHHDEAAVTPLAEAIARL